MPSIKELITSPATPDYFEPYLCPNRGICLDKNRIDLSVLCGSEREILNMPTNGDSSLVLRYQQKEGAALSLETHSDNLNIVQLQGARSRVSYKVTNGLNWVSLFGDQVEKIAVHSSSHFDRISMPSLEKIVGLYDSGSDAAVARYQQLVRVLGLRFSHEDYMFLRTISKPTILY